MEKPRPMHRKPRVRRIIFRPSRRPIRTVFFDSKIPEAYLDPANLKGLPESSGRIGRTRIVESRPAGLKPRFFVIKKFEYPTDVHRVSRLARVDLTGEARMALELNKKLKGTNVRVAKPIAIIYNRNGASRLVSEFVTGTEVAPGENFDSIVYDNRGFRIGYTNRSEDLEWAQRIVRSRGIFPIDLHGDNVLKAGNTFIIVDSKHLAFEPDTPAARKLRKHYWIYDTRGQNRKSLSGRSVIRLTRRTIAKKLRENPSARLTLEERLESAREDLEWIMNKDPTRKGLWRPLSAKLLVVARTLTEKKRLLGKYNVDKKNAKEIERIDLELARIKKIRHILGKEVTKFSWSQIFNFLKQPKPMPTGPITSAGREFHEKYGEYLGNE